MVAESATIATIHPMVADGSRIATLVAATVATIEISEQASLILQSSHNFYALGSVLPFIFATIHPQR